MKKKQLIIADDSKSLTESLMLAVNHQYPDIEVFTANSKDEIEAVIKEETDLVLLDIQFLSDDYDGIQIAQWIKDNFDNTRILMMSQYVKTAYKDLLINEIGVNGYIDKQSSLDLVLTSIDKVLSGELVIDPLVAETTEKEKTLNVSKREQEVLDLLERGETQKTIANKLFISPRTVEGHVKNLRDKFELKTTAELLAFYTKYKTSFREDGSGSNAPFLN
jgi:DNA-binding NarL/FixJ family response regulator